MCLAITTLCACHGDAQSHRRIIPVFGTMAEVEIVLSDPVRAEAALDRIEALYIELDHEWRNFGSGELGRVNEALRSGRRAPLSPRLERLIRRALEFESLSGGLFQPRVGSLVALWGFADMAHQTPKATPDEAAIARLHGRILQHDTLRIEDHSVSSSAPLELDLNAVAEGAALQAGAALLAELGVTDALIDTGGDLLALGRRGERPWRVGIRDPRSPGVLATVELQPGEAIASSGSYEHRFGAFGEHHHILDPRTGRPSRGSSGATVISRDAERADAAATALMVAGPAKFEEVVRRMGVALALLVAQDGSISATDAMRHRLGWSESRAGGGSALSSGVPN